MTKDLREMETHQSVADSKFQRKIEGGNRAIRGFVDLATWSLPMKITIRHKITCLMNKQNIASSTSKNSFASFGN